MADDSVVVKKSRPENAGNRLEDKTGMTPGIVRGDDVKPKAHIGCEGRKFIRKFLSVIGTETLSTSHLTGWGTLRVVGCDRHSAY